MRDQGLKTILMSGDVLATREFVFITGPAGEGVLDHPPDPRKRLSAAAVVKKFKDKGVDPEGHARRRRLRLGAEGRRRRPALSIRKRIVGTDAAEHLGDGARP